MALRPVDSASDIITPAIRHHRRRERRMARPFWALFALVASGAARADEVDNAIREVEKIGGEVRRGDDPGRPVVHVSFWRSRVTDADLRVLRAFHDTRKLFL